VIAGQDGRAADRVLLLESGAGNRGRLPHIRRALLLPPGIDFTIIHFGQKLFGQIFIFYFDIRKEKYYLQ
jgi:hypothetical protein